MLWKPSTDFGHLLKTQEVFENQNSEVQTVTVTSNFRSATPPQLEKNLINPIQHIQFNPAAAAPAAARRH